jgi:hypothetical protein
LDAALDFQRGVRTHSHALLGADNLDINLAVATCTFENSFHRFANLWKFTVGRQLNCDFGSFLLNCLIEFADFVEDDCNCAIIGVLNAAGYENDGLGADEIAVLAKRLWPWSSS